jgi:hypothetical protein
MKKKPSALQQAFLRELAAVWPLAKGSLALVRRPCIRSTCAACARGDKHAAWIFSFRQGGRQRCRYVPKGLAGLLRQAIANGRLVESLLTQAGADLIERHRRARGGGRAHG